MTERRIRETREVQAGAASASALGCLPRSIEGTELSFDYFFET